MTSTNLNWVGDHIRTLTIPIHFYNIPPHCPASFSTKSGAISKRQLPNPPSPPCVRSDVNAEIRRKATLLRQEFPDLVRGICKKPNSWYDLHNYFDAVDLWYEGPVFLFYVINHIYNENLVLNHELEETKLAEIREWARLWVEWNAKRILSFPPTQDLIAIFDECELGCIYGLDEKQLGLLRNALNDYRKGCEHLRLPAEEMRMQAPPQSIQHMHQPDASLHPFPHHQMQHGPPMMPPSMHMVPQGPPIGGRAYPVPVDESRRNQMMFVQPVPPMQHVIPQPLHSHIPYDKFMHNHGQVPVNGPHSKRGDFRHEANPQWERRQRGYSNETTRNGRGRGFSNLGYQNRSNYNANERRMVNDHSTPRGSPLRRASQSHVRQDPIYVHDSHSQSPPFDGDATPRADGRSVMQNNQRMVSEPVNIRTVYSNDARLWQPTHRQRANSKPQDYANSSPPTPPFEGHPKAVINPRGPNPYCTFWYEGEARSGTADNEGRGSRTVYVKNFQRSDFESHKLKELFSRYGRVEYIHFLYASYPQAFIAFMDETSVDAAISGLNEHIMPSGNRLFVNFPNSRPRSQSQSSQYAAYEPGYRSTAPRDFSYRGNNRRHSVRNQSTSYRAPGISDGLGRNSQASSNPSEGSSPVRTPLTEGFQAQLQPGQPCQITERLNSSIVEVVQHQAAINRFSNQNQMPLGNIENRAHARSFSNSVVDQSRIVMSQGSHNHKENSPMKKSSAKSTPFTSPKKDSSRPQEGGSNQKSNGGKNKKKANNQAWPNRDSRATSPIKPNFEGSLLAAIEAEEKHQQHTCPASAPETDVVNVFNPKATAPKAKVDASKADTPKGKADTPKAKANISKAKGPKHLTPKAVTPRADSKITPIVLAKKLEAEESGINPRMGDEIAGSVVKTENLELEDLTATAQLESEPSPVTTAEAKSIIEHPVISSPKPEISVNDSLKAVAEDKSSVEKTASPAPSSKSQTGGCISEVEVESRPKKKKKKNKDKKKQKRKSNAKSDAGQSTTSLNSLDSCETLKSSFMTEDSEHFVTAHSSPNPSLTSAPSDACLCADDTANFNFNVQVPESSPLENKHPDATMHSQTDSNTSAGSTPKSAVKSGNKSRKTHSKTDSNSSTLSTGSLRKADTKSKSGEKTDAEKDLQGSQKENKPSSPAVNLDDSTQWPTLGPAKAPTTVDSKQPAVPAPQPLSERKKNPNAPIIPAVPLNMQRRRPSIDSMAWPIVKKCDMK